MGILLRTESADGGELSYWEFKASTYQLQGLALADVLEILEGQGVEMNSLAFDKHSSLCGVLVTFRSHADLAVEAEERQELARLKNKYEGERAVGTKQRWLLYELGTFNPNSTNVKE